MTSKAGRDWMCTRCCVEVTCMARDLHHVMPGIEGTGKRTERAEEHQRVGTQCGRPTSHSVGAPWPDPGTETRWSLPPAPCDLPGTPPRDACTGCSDKGPSGQVNGTCQSMPLASMCPPLCPPIPSPSPSPQAGMTASAPSVRPHSPEKTICMHCGAVADCFKHAVSGSRV